MTIESSYHIAMHWRMIGSRNKLEGTNCSSCGELHFPGRPVCSDCGHNANTPTAEANPTPSNVVESQSGQTDIET